MSKPKFAGPDVKDKFHPDRVAENNAAMREAATPLVRSMMDEVDAAIDVENATMNRQFEADAKLRAWAKDLLGYQISMTQIETLRKEIAAAKPGKPFYFQETLLIKTAFGVVDRLDRYIFALEKTIVDCTTKTNPKPQFTDESFFGLMKLAFKRLFKRNK